jgi:DNA-binding transcriptional MerR regulator
MSVAVEEPGWPVEVLADRARLPVRTIREYQTMRVLGPPVRRGRVAFYGEAHLRRLELIGRLQDRGYSLAGMRDLFDAWAAGRDLAGVLAGPDGALAEEAPAVMDRKSLLGAFSHLPVGRLGELIALGVVIERADDEYCVPSPSLLGLLDDAIASGVSADAALAVAGEIAAGVRGIARAVAAALGEELGGRADDEAVVALMRRGRILVAQAASRLLLHELGIAMADPAISVGGTGMSGLVDRLRVGRAAAQQERTWPA